MPMTLHLLQILKQILEEKISQAGLEMIVKKTKTMLVSQIPMKKKINVKVNAATLDQVKQFKYFATQIKENSEFEFESGERGCG